MKPSNTSHFREELYHHLTKEHSILRSLPLLCLHTHVEMDESLGRKRVHEAGDDSDHHSTLGLTGRAACGNTHKAGKNTVVRGPRIPVMLVELCEYHGRNGAKRCGNSRGHHGLGGNTSKTHDGEGAAYKRGKRRQDDRT